MRLEDMILVSTDDHVIEPPDMFDRHLPERYKATGPKVMHLDDGTDRWIFQGNETGHFALGAVATWPKEEWSMDPGGYADMRPGCYTVHERLRDMDAGGVLSSMSFPTFAGFAGNHLARGETKTLTAVAFSAWNDWHIDEWCATGPGRLIPLGILPLGTPEAMVAEVHRIAKKGCTAVSLPETPHIIGLPSFYSGYWDPVFEALSDESIVACLHIGMAFNALTLPKETPEHLRLMMAPQLSAVSMSELIAAGIFIKFPDLRFAMSEGGIGWIPFYLDKLDRHVINQAWTGVQAGATGKLPTEVFRSQVLGCFITDESALRLRDRIGITNIAWECDYPHSDSTWPLGPELLFQELEAAGLSDQEIHKVTWENACRFLRLHPFAHVAKDQATVGALRARATDVDTTETSKLEYRRRYHERERVGAGS